MTNLDPRLPSKTGEAENNQGLNTTQSPQQQDAGKDDSFSLQIPQISLPKGGGAIKSIDEKFTVNAANGTAGISIPLPASAARHGFGAGLSVSYNSGSGNGIFGLGWNLSLSSITRKTDKGLPQYDDANDSDTYLLAEAEDLVPVLQDNDGEWIPVETTVTEAGEQYKVKRYRPRIEGGFARIERWTRISDTRIHWRTISGSNVSTLYGKDPSACIADPLNPLKIYSWLPDHSYDDKGNCIRYFYKADNLVNVPDTVSEYHRHNQLAAFANTYLERVQYGAKTPFDPTTNAWPEFMFETVLDYNAVAVDINTITRETILAFNNNWSCRPDAFSTYRSCFEIRTYRLCHRVWHFHQFNELGTSPYLVSSLEFNYEYNEEAGLVYPVTIQSKGYKKTGEVYSFKTVPPMQLTYQQPAWDTTVKDIPADQLNNMPGGIDGQIYQWVDLYNEGIPGILTEQGTGWFYKHNLGGGAFDKTALIASKPSFTGLSTATLKLLELEGDGRKFIASYARGVNGYYELTDTEEWLPFRSFDQQPNIDLDNVNIRILDLNGDGKADILINEDELLYWYESKGVQGYNDYRYVRKEQDEDKGPAVIFSDPKEVILLADMNGDGLTDIVRIRNGEVVYWPNMGYGQFGAKVVMDAAPYMDAPELFHAKNIRLDDINGSGSTDLIYLTHDSFKVWFNKNGNGWTALHAITPFPHYDHSAYVTVMDLLGHGTSCIVWSSPLPGHAGTSMRYIDLMGGKKPFVLTGYENNTGKRVQIEYASSTAFYLEDKKAGKPWKTKLPFPVQCVSKIITEDLEYTIGVLTPRLRFTQSYSYHHGYYDYAEREFRGFGRVDQTDTEVFENFRINDVQNVVEVDLHQPPVKTVTWYHTGVYFNRHEVLSHFAGEYTRGPHEFDLPEPTLPPDLTAIECREALRACKGMVLRQEVYALDGNELEPFPYSAGFHSCFIKMLQPKAGNRHAVFIVQESEAVTYQYERNLNDPRIAHTFNLEIDDFGHVLKSAAVVYGRKQLIGNLPLTVQEEQGKLHIAFTGSSVTNHIDTPDAYRLPASYTAQTYELTGVLPVNGNHFKFDELLPAFDAAAIIPFEQPPNLNTPQKRLTNHVQAIYLANDLVTPMPAGQIDTLGFSYQSYKLAFTPSLVNHIYNGKVTNAMLQDAGYVHQNDVNWWILSGRNIYLQNGETIVDARNRFYNPVAARNALEQEIKFTYDAYAQLLMATEDAMQNKPTVELVDYRLMQPVQLKDINDNIGEILTDELGLVIATAVRGTETGGLKGDEPLSNYTIVPVSNILEVMNDPHTYLQGATSYFYYDLFAFMNRQQPCCCAGIVRETHVSELNDVPSKLQMSVSYFSGTGQNLQTKVQAEPGLAFTWQNRQRVEVDTTPGLRWIGNGRTIFNNKGNPVKQYEPFFSTTWQYEPEKELTGIGFSSILYYDPVGRVVRTDHPDGTFVQTVFDAWKQQSMDANDTVLQSQWYIDRGSPDPASPEPVDAGTRAAWLAAKHANTASEIHTDSLGRTFYSITDNGSLGKYHNRSVLDISGRPMQVIDARNNVVMEYRYNLPGQQLYQKSMDAGERWLFNDVTGKSMLVWDQKDQRLRMEYDVINRPLGQWLTESVTGNSTEKLISCIVYGEGQPNDKIRNLRGKAFQHFDQSGRSEIVEFDFKGTAATTNKQLTINYKTAVDWNVPDRMAFLQTTIYTNKAKSDALERPIEMTAPDGSKGFPVYNESGALIQLQVFISRQNRTEEFVKNITYNAKGQRIRIVYGNNTASRYDYDEKTWRLTRQLTTRNNGADVLQDLQYTYDPVGNITAIRDDAQQTIFFNNALVEPHTLYEYDALYRLVRTVGREHAEQQAAPDQFDRDKTHDINGNHLQLKGDMNAMQRYEQLYTYDAAGNMLTMVHNAGNGSFSNRWTKNFIYNTTNNQLTSSEVSAQTISYNYDAHGNMINLQNGAFNMTWNFADQFKSIDLGGGGIAYYVYDATGQRVRKVIENGNLVKERIYLGVYEVYSELLNNVTSLERETLHVMDDANRMAMVESRTAGTDAGPAQLTRYQYSNHLGSACLEVDGDPANPAVISFEEYYPFGSTAYQSVRSQSETPNRYRFSGKERDEESGLNYHGARYYAPWLCRWTRTDPIGIKDGLNVYTYVSNNPVILHDPGGTDGVTPNQQVTSKEDPALKQYLTNMTKTQRGDFLRSTSGKANERVLANYKAYNLAYEEAKPAAPSKPIGPSAPPPALVDIQQYGDIPPDFGVHDFEPWKVNNNDDHMSGSDKYCMSNRCHSPVGGRGPYKLPTAMEFAGWAYMNFVVEPTIAFLGDSPANAPTNEDYLEGNIQNSHTEGEKILNSAKYAAFSKADKLFPVAKRLLFGSKASTVVDDVAGSTARATGKKTVFLNGEKTVIKNKENAYSFSTETDAEVVELIAKDIDSTKPGAAIYIGSGGHGNSKGGSFITDRSYRDIDFFDEDEATINALQDIGIGRVLNLADPVQLRIFKKAERLARKPGQDTVYTIRAWCFSERTKY